MPEGWEFAGIGVLDFHAISFNVTVLPADEKGNNDDNESYKENIYPRMQGLKNTLPVIGSGLNKRLYCEVFEIESEGKGLSRKPRSSASSGSLIGFDKSKSA